MNSKPPKAGMPPKRSEGDGDMEGNRSTAQLNNVARGVEGLKESIQTMAEAQVAATRRQAAAQEDSLKMAKQQFLFKTAPTDKTTYGFALRPRAGHFTPHQFSKVMRWPFGGARRLLGRS